MSIITKILKLKGFGIFGDFVWIAEIPEFKRFNLIYGWNRSGKTTISRIFSSCEKKCLYDKDKFRHYPENGEFEIKTNDNITINNVGVSLNALPIKVFNQDFIEDNISFDPTDVCNPIVYVSQKDIESKKKLEKLRADKSMLFKIYEDSKKDKATKEEIKANFLTDLGREIANLLFDKSYNKTKAENRIKEVGVNNFKSKILSDDEKKKYDSLSKGNAKKPLALLATYSCKINLDKEVVCGFNNIYNRVQLILSKKVISEVMDRLKNDQSLKEWVKQGFDLHKSRNERSNCLFCQKPLKDEYLDELARHFSKDYESLENTTMQLENELLNSMVTEISLTNEELYPDLQKEYEGQAEKYNQIVDKITAWVGDVILALQKKRNNPLEVVSTTNAPSDYESEINTIIDQLNKIISSHNSKVANHSAEVASAKEKLECHTIGVALSDQDFNKFNENIDEAEKREGEAFKAVKANEEETIILERNTSDVALAIPKINQHLKEFFGKEEIKLELDKDKKGYIIKRDGQPAINLSESEKTAIAFSYFVVKVEEKEFKIRDGIIFIDDPISSYDSNFIYHCFSLISTHFKDVGQLFISTHNFHLFNLVKHWYINKNHVVRSYNLKNNKSGRAEKPMPCEFFMIDNYIVSNARKAKLSKLDKTLLNYKSEYHYLFAKLKEFSEKTDQEYEDYYTIGNMARRFFDIFADFKVPTSGDQKSKMDVLVDGINGNNEIISKIDAGKAYKLVNDFSHNYDPVSTIEHKDKSESKEAIKVMLKIVKESDPRHYEILAEIKSE